jgi:hypothetical protein
MKILMPFISQDGNTLDDVKVVGGVERFQQLVYQNIPNIIPVNVPKIDGKISREADNIMRQAIEEHSPDIIFTNWNNTSLGHGLIKHGIKIVHVFHEPLERSILLKNTCENLIKRIEEDVDVYFVSQYQYDWYDKQCHRLLNRPLGNIKGFVSPAYADEFAHPNEDVIYDISTIGRNIGTKDPFWIHRKLKSSNLSSLVLTNIPQKYKSSTHNDYVTKNQQWTDPRHTFYNLSHRMNMQYIAQSSSFASTWQLESYGITALEALSHGIPTILLTGTDNQHASECFVADSQHIRKIKKSAKTTELESIIESFKEWSYNDRVNLSNATKDKNNKKDWIMTIENIFKTQKKVFTFKNELFSFV